MADSLKPAVYLHGDLGDVIHFGFYFAAIIAEHPGCALVHGTGKSRAQICPSLHADLRRIGFTDVVEIPQDCGTHKNNMIQQYANALGHDIRCHINYPDHFHMHRDRWRLQPNVFVHRPARHRSPPGTP